MCIIKAFEVRCSIFRSLPYSKFTTATMQCKPTPFRPADVLINWDFKCVFGDSSVYTRKRWTWCWALPRRVGCHSSSAVAYTIRISYPRTMRSGNLGPSNWTGCSATPHACDKSSTTTRPIASYRRRWSAHVSSTR